MFELYSHISEWSILGVNDYYDHIRPAILKIIDNLKAEKIGEEKKCMFPMLKTKDAYQTYISSWESHIAPNSNEY